MGVKGLSSLLKEKSEIFLEFKCMDSKLVVDGSSLVYQLYFKAHLDQNHGGEYLAFQVHIQAFFNTLSNCGIKPYVVMDGGLDHSNIKLDTIMNRARAKVQRGHKAAETGSKVNILPALVWFVFKQTLSDMKVPLAQCFGEADCELAALASKWRCPVLSEDSDFYIYDLPEGYLPLHHFMWDGVREINYIPCQKYTTTSFCDNFQIRHHFMPVFACLGGNDYVASGEIQWKTFLPPQRQKETEAGLKGLLVWLGTFRTLEETMTALMERNMSQEEQTKVKEAMLKYRLPDSSSLQVFFTKDTIPSLPTEMLSCVPNWLRAPLTNGDISGVVLNILLKQKNKLQTLVEHSDRQSSNLISKSIREVLYGLLLGQGRKVQEVDRDGLELVTDMVTPVVQGAAQELRLDSLPQADQAVRLQVCLDTLGVEETTLEGVPAHLRLPVAVTRYWQRRAKPKQMLLEALLLVMVEGELNRQRGSTTGWQGDTKHIIQLLGQDVAHSFNQWQACLMDASKLNQLLGMPLPRPHYAWLFQGRLVHQRMRELQTGTQEVHSEDFMVQYQSLLKAVLQ